MTNLRKIEQVYVKQAPALNDLSKPPAPKLITFIDHGQNWEDVKAHPREIQIIKGPDTPEMKAEICRDIRRGQGYKGDKVSEGMLYK